MSSDFDMDEITEIFVEESLEGLDVMESGLLNLQEGEADSEVMNDIFRAAHSIKGGAGTFGFMEISEFTHGVETLLDEMRSGSRAVTTEAVDLLLRTVDRLREMMTEIQGGGSIDISLNEKLQQEITKILESSNDIKKLDQSSSTSDDSGKFALIDVQDSDDNESIENEQRQWAIEFVPHESMLKKGNEPLRIFDELRKLGTLEVFTNDEELPALDQLEPTNCYLQWTLQLTGFVEEEQIKEAFDWVLEDCELKITELLEWMPVDSTPSTSSISKPANMGEKGAREVSAEKKSSEPTNLTASGNSVQKTSQVKKPAATKESTSIRVSIEKVDSLLNLVGELVITQSMLKRFDGAKEEEQLKELGEGLIQLERYTRELQESVMEIRMLPISYSFSRFPRLVRDISGKLGKKVELQVVGEHTELDKTVLEKIGDPLVHLVRNSLDHGIEAPEIRKEKGKPEVGKLTLSASQEGGNIVIRVIDDGAGLNRDKLYDKAIEKGIIGPDDQLTDDRIYNLIFHPGFSTVEKVSDLSGRGVGMDVVRRNIKDLGGRVEVQSELNKGASFTIRLPLTLAILDGQLVRVGKETYIISLLSIVETVLLSAEQINDIAGRAEVYQMRGEYIPVVWLKEVLQNEAKCEKNKSGLLVIVEADGRRVGLYVDELLDQQQVVIKSLEDNFCQVDGVSGATILGDGTVALILDIPGLLHGCLSNDDPTMANAKNAA